MPVINAAQYESISYGPETTFGVAAATTFSPRFETWSPNPKNNAVWRNDTGRRPGRSQPGVGPYDFSASLSPSTQPDVVLALLKYALGAQSTPTGYQWFTANTAGSMSVGATAIPVSTGVGLNSLLTVGTQLLLDSGGNLETVTVGAGSTSTSIVISAATKAHASGVAIRALSTAAYNSTLSIAPPSVGALQSFTAEYVIAPGDARDYLGCTIDTLKLSGASGSNIKADFGIVAASELIQTSPATPVFSSAMPLQYDIAVPGTASVLYNGVAVSVPVRKWNVDVNNQLDKKWLTAGSRFPQGFPRGQVTASGSIELGYVDAAFYRAFLGSSTATSPQTAIGGVSFLLAMASPSYADPAKFIQYQMALNLPNCFLNTIAVPGAPNGGVVQTLSWDNYETPGQGDDFSISITSATGSAY